MPIDGVLRVVVDKIIEGVKQLLTDAERVVVNHDAEMFVAIWRFQRQCVVADLSTAEK